VVLATRPGWRWEVITMARLNRRCVECGGTIARRRKDAIYCSRRCGWRVRQRRRRQRLRSARITGEA
jgi:predicted nucleic acid-binding Zn ribbon protein